MGIMTDSQILTWEESAKHAEDTKKKGTQQFINHYNKHKTRQGDPFLWGDELEHYLIKFDHSNKKAYLALKANHVVGQLKPRPKHYDKDSRAGPALWLPEFAKYQVESIPGSPYVGLFNNVEAVEKGMTARRQELNMALLDDEMGMSLAVFPSLNCDNYTWPSHVADPSTNLCQSTMYPVEAIANDFPRYKALVLNTYERRGERCVTNLPIYRDAETPDPFIETTCENSSDVSGAKVDHIHIDYPAVDCNGLQINIQAGSLTEARILYDQLAVVAPLMLALTASSPIRRGYILDQDTRWSMVEGSTDYRTTQERGSLTSGEIVEKKTLVPWGSIEGYLSPGASLYHDVDFAMDTKMFQRMLEGGVDELMARHMAHVSRVPLLTSPETIRDAHTSNNNIDVFQMLCSASWQVVKLKLPQDDLDDGWKVEFRTMEAQVTDFENAAACVFIVLLSRVILEYDLDLRIPISLAAENLQTAYIRDAARKGQFHFRKDIAVYEKCAVPGDTCLKEDRLIDVINDNNSNTAAYNDKSYDLMSIDEIFHGKSQQGGLISLMQRYLDDQDLPLASRQRIDDYISLMTKRATGELITPASWMRHFVTSHPDYKKDSVVSDRTTYDLIQRLAQVCRGEVEEPRLLPNRR